jgi:excisionase family DNA binding protein
MTELLTLPEVAARLRVSVSTVRRFVASGQLRPVYIGRKPLVTVRELEAFIAHRKAA